VPLCKTLAECGVRLLELGFPSSDPIGDGETIQEASAVALENGVNLKWIFEQLAEVRAASQMPIVLMGYINQVMQYGIEEFCRDAAKSGADGIIIPDLPLNEYRAHFKHLYKKEKLASVFLITPETSQARIAEIDFETTGFIYAVSSSSITGGDATLNIEYLKRLKDLELKNPFLVGFGINDKKSFDTVAEYAKGAIIGSAYVRALKGSSDPVAATKGFIKSILE
jgi:tryptophan synthase alpha chain